MGHAARWRFRLAAGLLPLLLGASPSQAVPCVGSGAGGPWPVPDWAEAPLDDGSAAALLAYAFPPGLDEVAREGIRSNALLVVKGGRLVLERYARGFDGGKPHIAWSVTKSVMATLVGRSMAMGLLAGVHQPAARFYPVLAEPGQDPRKAAMTVGDLLHMTSGLDYQEAYEFAPLWSDVIAMLYTRGHADMARYTAERPLLAGPGDSWSYSSGDSVLLAAVLRGIVGEAAYASFPWDALFDPLGMEGAVFERDPVGTFIGSSNLYLRPRDLARIGLLHARDGCWDGQRLLPEGWVAYAGTPIPAEANGGRQRAYGAQWWLNRVVAEPPRRMLPSAPEDALVGSGHWGQFLVIVPSLDLVVVRNGDDRDGSFSLDRLVRLAIEATGGSADP